MNNDNQNQQEQQTVNSPKSQEQMLVEILENTRKTKNYIKWSMIITVAFVVLPLIAALVVIPLVLKSLSSAYSGLI